MHHAFKHPIVERQPNPRRRSAIVAAGCGLVLMGPAARFAQAAPAQGAWRYCRKCHVMFFNGYPAKGTCPGGGGHEAAGYSFMLPYDAPETAGAQRNWRFCQKCNAMFFDGYPAKGACPAGGGHAAAGFHFVLPHSAPETPVAQAGWRFCDKCNAMFYDGYPDKGLCKAGGGHRAAGLNFVLKHATDYPAKVAHLTTAGAPMLNVLQIMWRDEGRRVMGEGMQQAINGRRFADGVNGYDAQASIGDMVPTIRPAGEDRFAVEMNAPGNDIKFHATTPTIFGAAMDPAFRVGFGMLVKFDMSVRNARPAIDIASVDAILRDASVHGANAVGTLVETVGDFFTGGDFSRSITERINGDPAARAQLSKAVAAALDQVF